MQGRLVAFEKNKVWTGENSKAASYLELCLLSPSKSSRSPQQHPLPAAASHQELLPSTFLAFPMQLLQALVAAKAAAPADIKHVQAADLEGYNST